jgi:lipopolysaccharide transport system permease protein
VAYASSLVPPAWRPVYALNPMAGAIDAMRWAVLGTAVEAGSVAISVAVAAVLCVSGLLVFRRLERRFADLV